MRIIDKAERKVSENKANRIVYNSDYDFTINTDYAKVIEINGLKNYTFGVYRSEENGLLENLLLEQQADSTFKVSLVQYNITESEKNSLINREIIDAEDKITFIALDDISDTIFSKVNSDAETCTVYSYEWSQGSSCASGNHEVSDGGWSATNPNGCHYWGNPNQMATSGGYFLTASESVCGSSGSTPGPINPSGSPSGGGQGGNSGGGNYVPPTTTPVLCPKCPEIEEDGLARECSKINRQLSKFPSLRQDLINLKAQTSASMEHGIFIDDTATSSTLNPSQPIPQLPDGSVQPNTNPVNDYVMMAHTHNSPSSSTYSVPSWEDLTSIADLTLNGHIDVSEFVFYLFTADGTSYAITINDASDLADFFLDPSDPNLNNPNDPNYNENRNKIAELARARVKYYYNKPPIIQENSTDYNQDLIHFLTLLKEADMGLSVFEIDNNITTFTEVTLNNTNDDIVPNNCN